MPDCVEITRNRFGLTIVTVYLDRDYRTEPISEILKDAWKEIQKDLTQQLIRER